MYSADPIIYVVSDFLSEEECNAFIELGKGKMKRATVISDSDNELHDSRTNDYCWIKHDLNDVIHEASKRFSVLVKMPINNAEQFQLVYYGPAMNISLILMLLIKLLKKVKIIGFLVAKE